ncbi:MAG: asparagine synthetase B family protein [Deferrisomatales bacterium]
MRPVVPMGGFFAARQEDGRTTELLEVLRGAGAQTVSPAKGLALAAWRDFPGQGLWVGERGAVAYDLDLHNEGELRALAGIEASESCDPGRLLWTLYERLGESFLDSLRGAFGFALWDGANRSLLVVTDFYGIRPVVYAQTGTGLVAASRIRHALLHPGVPREIDPEAVYQYLFFSAIPSPTTIYRGVRKLEPGTCLVRRAEQTSFRTYYDIRYRPDDAAGESYWKKSIPLEVRRAVGRCVPLTPPEQTGCFLSGGTDSSSVAGYYTQLAGRPARTFSIGFDEPGYNEMEYAHLAARHFGTEQHEYFVRPEDVLALVESLPQIYDEPFGNSSVIPTYFCAKLAREAGVDVLLAGDGGDEIFGGNERYVTNLVFERYGRIPGVLRKGLLEPALRALPSIGPIHKAKRYVRRASLANPERFFSYNLLYETDPREIFRAEFLEQIDTNCFLGLAQAHYDRAAPAHDTDRLLYLDMKLTITDNDLRKVTQMTEAAGVRVRYPLLDRELVDFAGTVPPDLKVKPGKNRYAFKKAMEGFLPEEIIRKTKHGFGLPVAPWFRRDPRLHQLLLDALFARDCAIQRWVHPDFLGRMKTAFEGDATGYYGGNFWVFLMLELWLQRWECGTEPFGRKAAEP